MATSGRTEIPRALLGLAAGGVCLYFVDLIMQPAPLAAGAAFAAGAIVMLISCFRPLKTSSVAFGALGGALPALWVHRGWHLGGSSPEPTGSLVAHVMGQGLLGLTVALVCLGIAELVWRRLAWSPADRPADD